MSLDCDKIPYIKVFAQNILQIAGIFEDKQYWDVEVEYCKENEEALLCRYTVHNRSELEATIHILPTLWFRLTYYLLNLHFAILSCICSVSFSTL